MGIFTDNYYRPPFRKPKKRGNMWGVDMVLAYALGTLNTWVSEGHISPKNISTKASCLERSQDPFPHTPEVQPLLRLAINTILHLKNWVRGRKFMGR
jgi:hypothetical protein